MGKRTYEVNIAKSVKPPLKGQYRATQTGSVETLHDGAEMPKIKSGQQILLSFKRDG